MGPRKVRGSRQRAKRTGRLLVFMYDTVREAKVLCKGMVVGAQQGNRPHSSLARRRSNVGVTNTRHTTPPPSPGPNNLDRSNKPRKPRRDSAVDDLPPVQPSTVQYVPKGARPRAPRSMQELMNIHKKDGDQKPAKSWLQRNLSYGSVVDLDTERRNTEAGILTRSDFYLYSPGKGANDDKGLPTELPSIKTPPPTPTDRRLRKKHMEQRASGKPPAKNPMRSSQRTLSTTGTPRTPVEQPSRGLDKSIEHTDPKEYMARCERALKLMRDHIDDHYNRFNDFFFKLDFDHKGSIDINKFLDGLRKENVNLSREEGETLFSEVVKHSGTNCKELDFLTFLKYFAQSQKKSSAFLQPKVPSPEAWNKPLSNTESALFVRKWARNPRVRMADVLRVFDPLQHGFVTRTAFRAGMRKLCPSISIGDCDQAFHDADIANNGFCVYRDFVRTFCPPDPPCTFDMILDAEMKHKDFLKRTEEELQYIPDMEGPMDTFASVGYDRRTYNQDEVTRTGDVARLMTYEEQAIKTLRDKFQRDGKRLRTIFDNLTFKNEGVMTINEFAEGLKDNNIFLPTEVVESTFSEIDTDGDGRIVFSEFENAFDPTIIRPLLPNNKKPPPTRRTLSSYVDSCTTQEGIDIDRYKDFDGDGVSSAASRSVTSTVRSGGRFSRNKMFESTSPEALEKLARQVPESGTMGKKEVEALARDCGVRLSDGDMDKISLHCRDNGNDGGINTSKLASTIRARTAQARFREGSLMRTTNSIGPALEANVYHGLGNASSLSDTGSNFSDTREDALPDEFNKATMWGHLQKCKDAQVSRGRHGATHAHNTMYITKPPPDAPAYSIARTMVESQVPTLSSQGYGPDSKNIGTLSHQESMERKQASIDHRREAQARHDQFMNNERQNDFRCKYTRGRNQTMLSKDYYLGIYSSAKRAIVA